MKFNKAPDVQKVVAELVHKLSLTHITVSQIHCIRSLDAKTRATARIWGIPKLFKDVVGLEPHYIIEVNSKRFDKLHNREKINTLVHELMHIPKTFSGALLPHRGRFHRINNREIAKLLKNIKM